MAQPKESPPATAAAEGSKTILIVDDHPVVCQGLRQLIGTLPGLSVCADAANIADALAAVDRCRPDMVVADISLGATSGIDLVKEVRSRHPDLPILVLSMHDESVYAERALRAGANGYIMKHEPAGRLVAAIRRVLAGQVYVSDDMVARLLQRFRRGPEVPAEGLVASLTDRELDVFRLVGAGYSTQEIAARLFISPKTVESHVGNIRDKLQVRTGRELACLAAQWIEQQQHK